MYQPENRISILKAIAGAAPAQWECLLPDGTAGFIHYRSGELSLCDSAGGTVACSDNYDAPHITLEEVTSWLLLEGYNVEW